MGKIQFNFDNVQFQAHLGLLRHTPLRRFRHEPSDHAVVGRTLWQQIRLFEIKRVGAGGGGEAPISHGDQAEQSTQETTPEPADNSLDEHGKTLLHRIAAGTHLEESSAEPVVQSTSTSGKSPEQQPSGTRESVKDLLDRGADLSIQMRPGLDGKRSTYENPVHTAFRHNNLEFLKALQDKKDSLGESFDITQGWGKMLHEALHMADAHAKVPAAYAQSKEAVDIAVALGTDKNFYRRTSENKVIGPPYAHSPNDEVAHAWMAHEPETDYGTLLINAGDETTLNALNDGMPREGVGVGKSVAQYGLLKTGAIVRVLCNPDDGKVNPSIIGRPFAGHTVLHDVDDADVAQAYIEQILARPGGEDRLKDILASPQQSDATCGCPLSTAKSFDVAKVLLHAGSPCDRSVVENFKKNNSDVKKCDRYTDTLWLLTATANRRAHAARPLNEEQQVAVGEFLATFGTAGGNTVTLPSRTKAISLAKERGADFREKVDIAIDIGWKHTFDKVMRMAELNAIDLNEPDVNGETCLHRIAAGAMSDKMVWPQPADSVTETSASGKSTEPQPWGTRERVKALIDNGGSLLVRKGPGIDEKPGTYENAVHSAFRHNNLEFLKALQDKKDSLGENFDITQGWGEMLHKALHMRDANFKVPAAYAQSKEAVDIAVALGTNINYFDKPDGKVEGYFPAYAYSANEEVARAWVAHQPELNCISLMYGNSTRNKTKETKETKRTTDESVAVAGFLKSKWIVRVMCNPVDGEVDPTIISGGMLNNATVLHNLDDADVAQEYVDQILAHPDGRRKLDNILAQHHENSDGTPLLTAGSYGVVKVLLKAGARCNERDLELFKEKHKHGPRFDRYGDALAHLTAAAKKQS